MTNKPVQQKPDPAVGRNIRRARRSPGTDKAKSLVVAVSLATTLMGWGIFAREDAQTAALQAADATPVAAVVANTSTSAGTSQSASAVATATVVPIVTTNAGTSSTQSSSATTAAGSSTTTAASSQSSSSTTTASSSSTTSQVAAVARTRSSR